MAKLTLTDISSGYALTTTVNANNALIEAALENTLSRDGTTPNTMSSQLDMNSNRIVNLPNASNNSEPVTLGQASSIQAFTGVVATAGAVGAVLWPQTAAESTASVTPTNYEYEPGNVLRYGSNTTPGTTDMTAAIQAALDSNSAVYIPAGTYKVTTSLQVPSETLVYGDGYDKTFISSSYNGPIIASEAYFAANSVSPTGDVQLRDFSIDGDAAQASQIGILLHDYYSTIENINIYKTQLYAIQYTHTDDGATPVGGTLVNNRIRQIRTNNTGPLYLGDEDNNKLTDGVVEDAIISIGTGQDYALFIGSAAGWFIDDVHTEGNSAAEASIHIANAFNTQIGKIYAEGDGVAGKPVFNFTKMQKGLSIQSLSAPLETATAIGVQFAKSGSVASAEVNIANLYLHNDSATAVTGIKLATGTVKVNVANKSYVNLGGGTITDSYSSQVSRGESTVEYGTWTPDVKGSGTAGTYTNTSTVAEYYKVGGWVQVHADIQFSAASGGTTSLIIDGLPYAYSANTLGMGTISAESLDLTNANPANLTVERATTSSDTRMIVRETNDNAASSVTAITGVSTSTRLRLVFSYFTDS